jgi:hypothetical protein
LQARWARARDTRFPVWMATTEPGSTWCSISQPANAALRSANSA